MVHDSLRHLLSQSLVSICVKMNSVPGLPVRMVLDQFEKVVKKCRL